eukprot:gene25332-3638_t
MPPQPDSQQAFQHQQQFATDGQPQMYGQLQQHQHHMGGGAIPLQRHLQQTAQGMEQVMQSIQQAQEIQHHHHHHHHHHHAH